MTRIFVTKHADTHRPAGTLGPADRGGSDPITGFGVATWGYYEGSISLTGPGFATFVWDGNLSAGTEMFSYGTGTDSPAPLTNGLYALSASITPTSAPAPPAADNFMIQLLKGTVPTWGATDISPRETMGGITLPTAAAAATWPLTTSDYFTLQAWSNTGSALVFGVVAVAARIEAIP